MRQPAQNVLLPFRAPARLSRFPRIPALVGRQGELSRLVALFDRGERLITVLGPPGIGKTSLATRAAELLSPRRPGWFCDLTNQRSASALCLQVMSLWGAPASASASSPSAVAEVLSELGPALLVLDNFEQLMASAPLLELWSQSAPEIIFVVTSRERLAIKGECVVELAPLSIPAVDHDAGASEAVQLFQQRARDAGATGADDLEAIADIVAQLDGIPLAIELAAARTRLMSPRELSKRLRHGEDVLALTKRSPARHQTLAKAIEWSWELLTEPERRALACCSLFAGSFGIEAAERVLGAAMDDGAAIEVIAALREKSLIHVAGEGRLGLYLSIRQFAAKKLSTEFAAMAISAAHEHARVFAEIAARFTRSRLLLSSAMDVHAQIRRDVDNLTAALAVVDEASQNDPPWPERVEVRAELLCALTFLPAIVAQEAERRLDQTLAEARALSPQMVAVTRLTKQVCLADLGRLPEALAEATAITDSLDADPNLRAAALVRLGIQQRDDGDASAALASHERAAALIPSSVPTCLLAVNTACIGRLKADLRQFDDARIDNERAESVSERIGERWLTALARANVAQLEQELGHWDRAEALLDAAIAQFRDAGEPQYEGFYAAICGGLFLEWGKWSLARHWYDLSKRPIETVSRGVSGVLLHGGFAVLEARDGDNKEAAAQLELASRRVAQSPSPINRILLELLRAAAEVELETTTEERLQAYRNRLAELMKPARTGGDGVIAMSNTDTRFAMRILKASLERRASRGAGIQIDPSGMWFAIRGQHRVDLSRRGALRRLALALTEAHENHRGVALGVEDLVARGWPGERIQTEAASTRVRVAIATLRKLGLREVLLTREDGYLLDPTIAVDWAHRT